MDSYTMNQFTGRHLCNSYCTRPCNQQIAMNSLKSMFNTLPNNRDNTILIESKSNLNLRSTTVPQTSKFSNFSNYKTMLDKKHRQRSKFFDVYYPSTKKDKNSPDSNSVCDSLSSSQSSSSIDAGTKSDFDSCNSTNSKFNNKTVINEEIKNFNLNTNPIQFNMDKVNYVEKLTKAKTVIDDIMERSKVIALNCDSDCCLQNDIDLLEVAVKYDDTLCHPDIFVFDINLEPKIIELFKPVFSNSKIVKVMFDARFDLRILSRKYGVTEFTALFDIQLAYRFLLAKLTNRNFDQIKREKLLYVSWQCNGPLANFEKLYLPAIYYFKNKNFWKTRPVNFEIMYNAAYDVFVMIPQLFTNLVVIMEKNLTDQDQQSFVKQSNNLICRNLVPRKFSFFQTKHQYFNEMHKQIDLLIHSDILHRNRQFAKWQNQLTDAYDTITKDKYEQEEGRQEYYLDACTDYETKCMNLLVDQIIDLAECKEDFMELEE